jgi:uncharacterized protein YaaN involved in tellurite resistance
MEIKKLTEEEVLKLKTLQTQFQELVIAVGDTETQIMEIELRKEKFKSDLIQLKQQESVLVKELEDKYGNGSISLETGEFIPLKT